MGYIRVGYRVIYHHCGWKINAHGVVQWSEHLQLGQEAVGLLSSWLTNVHVHEMKDLWCSGTVWLPSTDMNGAPVVL